MCGRYASAGEFAEEAMWRHIAQWWAPRYNIAPTATVPYLRARDGEVEGLQGRWGLVPFFTKGDAGKFSMHNARIETVQTSGAYRGPWKRGQRCLIPATGFYEWHMDSDAGKHPFYIRTVDQDVYGFAGLWERSTAADGVVVESCTIITMPANELMRDIHNTGAHPHRMPAIMPAAARETWLKGTNDEAWDLLKPYDSGDMVAWRVTDRVNNARNESADLVEPVETPNKS